MVNHKKNTKNGYRARNGTVALASAILLRAKRDVDLIMCYTSPPSANSVTFGAWETPVELGFHKPHDELAEFFQSSWCAWLCDAADIEPSLYIKEMQGKELV